MSRSIKIGNFAIWMSADEARALGCTHHARMWGIVPGFYGEETWLWVGRSDLLNWLENLLTGAVATMAALRGEHFPGFGFQIREPIARWEDDV